MEKICWHPFSIKTQDVESEESEKGDEFELSTHNISNKTKKNLKKGSEDSQRD